LLDLSLGSAKFSLFDLILPPLGVLIAILVNFTFTSRMQKRERAWIISVAAIYPFLGVLLSIFLDPTRERQTADLVKVFFTASHAVVAILIGYGMALIASFMATHYEKFRRWGLAGAGVAIALALSSLVSVTAENYFGLGWRSQVDWARLPHWMTHLPPWIEWIAQIPALLQWIFANLPHWIAQSFAPHQYGSPVIASLMLVGMTLVFLAALLVYKERAPLGITLTLFALLPVYSGMSHWFKCEQHNHWFGYWFGHDMFTAPFVGPDGQLTYDATLREAAAKGPHGAMVYPEMARDAVLFGGTDPGRFCPTYTIFCESFIPHDCQPEQDQHYDRRDVYIITQNALADGTYLDYIRAQFNRSAQYDPPFFQNFFSGSLPKVFHGSSRWLVWLDDIFEGIGARVERRRAVSTSWFAPDQFLSAEKLAAKLRPGAGQDALGQYLYGNLSKETQQLVEGKADETALRRALSKDLNAMLGAENIYTSERFKNIPLPPLIQEAAAGDPILPNNVIIRMDRVIRLNRRMLEEAYPEAIVKSLGGVYPDTEIITPSPDDSATCFNEYYADAKRRLQHDSEFPNERRQLKPGEMVSVENDRLQISGQVAVMSINGLLTKVIFDKNPRHEFYVEESFPLDWMYPYLTPFGVIMKINRHPIQELSQEVIDKDHAFWSEYSRRTIGNWITYNTSVKEICDWAEAVYLRHDFSHFTGDPRFIRDDDAQKAFSKLRSSIASSIYLWRSSAENSRSAMERPRVTKEAEFALKQAFAYCPYSPEAVVHFMNLLLSQNRADDAIAVLETCQKLDPYNPQISEFVEEVKRSKSGVSLAQVFAQVQHYMTNGQTNAAQQLLDQVLNYPGADANALMMVADSYLKMGNMAKSEQAVQRMTQVEPDNSSAWYNLAAIQAHRGEITQAVAALKKSLDLNDAERPKNPKAPNLRQHLFEDANFTQLRKTAEFIAAFGAKP
jgi:tetratricopeptide (TPR) repeat protein